MIISYEKSFNNGYDITNFLYNTHCSPCYAYMIKVILISIWSEFGDAILFALCTLSSWTSVD